MSLDILKEAVLAFVGGAITWAFFWTTQRFGEEESQTTKWYLFTAPSWLSLVCGRPLTNNKLELALSLGQLGGVLLGLLWLPAFWFGLDHSQRIFVWSCTGVGTVVVSFVVRLVIIFANRSS